MSALLSLACQKSLLFAIKYLICRVGLIFLLFLLFRLLIRIYIIVVITTWSVLEWKISLDLETPQRRTQLGAVFLKDILEGIRGRIDSL